MNRALFVGLCISLLCPCIGIFMVLRKSSMIGDTMSHASLAGISLGMLSGMNPIAGSFLFTALCGALIEGLRKYFPHYLDLILTITLSLSAGTAITILSSGLIRGNASAFFFGSILTVTPADMIGIAVLTFCSLLLLAFFYDSLVCLTYDEEAARVAGVRVDLFNYVFAIIMAAAVSISIKIVGVLVLSSMIALPVAGALQLEKGFRATLLWSMVLSLLSMMAGLMGSFFFDAAPGGLVSLASVALLLVIIAGKQWKKVLSGRRSLRGGRA